MAPGKFSILGMTATRQRLHYYNTMDKNTIKELCAVQSKSLAVTYIFQLTGQWTSLCSQNGFHRWPSSHWAQSKQRSYVTQSGDFIIWMVLISIWLIVHHYKKATSIIPYYINIPVIRRVYSIVCKSGQSFLVSMFITMNGMCKCQSWLEWRHQAKYDSEYPG